MLNRRNLGGKFGVSLCEDFGAEFMGDLVQYSESDFSQRYGEKSGYDYGMLCALFFNVLAVN